MTDQHANENDMTNDNNCVHDTMVPGDADDMAEALSEIAAALGCANTKDDILDAIDALKRPPHDRQRERYAAG